MSDSIAPEYPPNISIRVVNPSDSHLLLTWRNHPEVRRWSRDLSEIEVNTHETWFNSWISNRQINGFFYVIEYLGTPVGAIRFDLKSKASFEVSILIEPGFQGRGIAKDATAAAIREIGSKFSNFTILASVHEKNTPSVKLFTNLGFQECGKSGDFLDFFRNFHFENF